MTLSEILDQSTKSLEKENVPNAGFDAHQIILNLLNIDMARYLALKDLPIREILENIDEDSFLDELDELINLRGRRVPLQYILGDTFFCGLEFKVNQNVLIPRSDTETLVEKVLQDNADKNMTVLDMCTGSGCIGIALAKLGKYKKIVCADISEDAIEIASRNAEKHLDRDYAFTPDDEQRQEVLFLVSDLFKNFDVLEDKQGIKAFDIITINPPYIKTDEINSLQEEVRFEPKLALDGGIDGLSFYKRIASEVRPYLKENGKVYLEIGCTQKDEVSSIFEDAGFEVLECLKDLGGLDRVLVIK